GDDAGYPDGAGRRPAAARHRSAPRRAEGHGLEPGRHDDRGHLGAGGRRHPDDAHPRGGARHAALARARAGSGLMLSSPVLFLVNLLHLAITIYIWIIIIRALISWVSPDPFNPVVRFLYQATEPVLRPIRRSLPTYQIGLDLSPMIVIVALEIIDRFVLPTLVSALLY